MNSTEFSKIVLQDLLEFWRTNKPSAIETMKMAELYISIGK
jgi:hypothetical protein